MLVGVGGGVPSPRPEIMAGESRARWKGETMPRAHPVCEGGGAGLAGGSRKRDSPTGAMRSSRAVMLVV